MPNVKDLLEQLKTGAASQKKAAQTQANANGRGSIGDLAAQIKPDAMTEGELFRKLNSHYYDYSTASATDKGKIDSLNLKNDRLKKDVESFRSVWGDKATDKEIASLNAVGEGIRSLYLGNAFENYGTAAEEYKKLREGDLFGADSTQVLQKMKDNAESFNRAYYTEWLDYVENNRESKGDKWADDVITALGAMHDFYNGAAAEYEDILARGDELASGKSFATDEEKYAYMNDTYRSLSELSSLVNNGISYKEIEGKDTHISIEAANLQSLDMTDEERREYLGAVEYNGNAATVNGFFGKEGAYAQYGEILGSLGEGDAAFDYSSFSEIEAAAKSAVDALSRLDTNDANFKSAKKLAEQVLSNIEGVEEAKRYYDYIAEQSSIDAMSSEEIGRELVRLEEMIKASKDERTLEVLNSLKYYAQIQMVGKTDADRAGAYKEMVNAYNKAKNDRLSSARKFHDVKLMWDDVNEKLYGYLSEDLSPAERDALSKQEQELKAKLDAAALEFDAAQAVYKKYSNDKAYYEELGRLNTEWREKSAGWAERALASVPAALDSFFDGAWSAAASAIDTVKAINVTDNVQTFVSSMLTDENGKLSAPSLSRGWEAVKERADSHLVGNRSFRNSELTQRVIKEGEYAEDPLFSYDASYQPIKDIAGSMGQMVPSLALSLATGGGSMAVQMITTGASGFQQGYQSAKESGAGEGHIAAYATFRGFAEGISELIGGKITKIGGGAIGKFGGDALARKITSPALKTFASLFGTGISEAIEEGTDSVADQIVREYTFDSDGDWVNWSEVGYESLLGGVAGGIMRLPAVSADYKINKDVIDRAKAMRAEAAKAATPSELQAIYTMLQSSATLYNDAVKADSNNANLKYMAYMCEQTAAEIKEKLPDILAKNDVEGAIKMIDQSVSEIISSEGAEGRGTASAIVDANLEWFIEIIDNHELDEDVREKFERAIDDLWEIQERYELEDYSAETDSMLVGYKGVEGVEYDLSDSDGKNVRAASDIKTGTVHLRTDLSEYGGTKKGVDNEKAHEVLHLAANNDPKLLGRLKNMLKAQGVNFKAETAKLRDAYIEQYKKDWYRDNADSAYKMGAQNAEYQAKQYAEQKADATLEEEVIAKHFGKVASELGLGNIVSDSFMDRVVRRANTAVGREYNKTLNRKITKAVSQYAKTAKDAEKRKKRSERKAKVKEKVKAEKEAKNKKSNEYLKYVGKKAEQILALLSKVKDGTFKDSEKVYFENVEDTIAETIKEKTGIDVSGFKVAIEARQLEHILKRHGENGKSDHSMSNDSDIAKIEYVLNSPDDIRNAGKTQAYSYMKDGKNRTADTVLYEKSIGEQSYYVVQAVPDTKAKTLYIVSAFIGNPGYKKETSQLTDAHNVPSVTSNDGSAIVSDNIVSQPTEKVNTKKAKSQTSANLSANAVYTTHKQLKAGDKVGEVTLVRDSETGESVTPKLHASFDKYNTPSFVLATVESLGNEELIAALEEETVLMLADENAELPLHDTVEELSEYVKDGSITPEQAARILGNEYANPTGTDVDTLVARELADDGVRYSVAGEGSATADGSMLAVAKYYWNTPGTDHANITAETGWWYDDVDGKWKYEISDSKMVFEPNGLVSDPQTLADYVKHDKLFAAYPQLKDVTVKYDTFAQKRRYGFYDVVTNTIVLNKNIPDTQKKKTLVHEIQHAVQHIEHFATGTNENTAYIYLFNKKYKAVKGTAEYKALSTPDERFDYIENSIDPDEIERRTKTYDRYKNSHGEVEARESADRMGYDDDDLRKYQRKTNTAPAIDRNKVNGEFVDILSELGYTEGEINLYRERSGITNDEQRNVSKSDISGIARNDIGERRGFGTIEAYNNIRRQSRGISGRQEPLGRSDAGADTASERQYDNRIRYSLAEPDMLPAVDRDARTQNIIRLADVLQNDARNDAEYAALDRVKKNAEKIVQKYDELSALKSELKEISFATGPRDTARIESLNSEIEHVQRSLNSLEGALTSSHAAAPFKDMMQRKIQSSTTKARRDYYERQKANTQSRKNTETRNKIKRLIAQLDSLYMHPTKQRNVNNDIQEPVFAAIQVGKALFTNISNAEIARFSNLKLEGEEISALKDYRVNLSKRQQVSAELEQASKSGWDTSALEANLEEINAELKEAENGALKGLLERERNAFKDTKASEAINELAKVYTTIQSFEKQPALKEYNDKIFEQLEVLKDYIGEVTLRDMNSYQLERLYGAYKMILHAVRRANQVFIDGRRAETTQITDECIAQFKEVGESEDRRSNWSLNKSKAFWYELLPIYAVRYLGSDTFERLYNSLKGGQYVWARDVAEASGKVRDIRQKYGADEWNSDELHLVWLENGASVELTLGQLMSIYAYSKRKQAKLHMSIGGFSLEADIVEHYKVNLFGKEFKTPFKTKSHDTSAHTYRIGDSDIETVKKLLGSKTQYVDEMQDYLSSTMAEKGNETSRELYGIDLFHETNYFPIMSVEGYRQQTSIPALQNALANSGMTKNTVPNADSPMALCNFDDVWTKHVNQMSSYHAFSVGIDSMNKVMAYNLRGELSNSKTGSMSFKDTLDNLYGKAAYEYFDKLIQDVNGGVHLSDIDNPLAKAFSLSKKAAVAASVSVMVQQPTAVTRAMAHVDAKYFVHKRTMNHAEKWEELKKYAPIAIIKEIGGYDVQSSRGTADSYIFGKEYGVEALDGNVIEKSVTAIKNAKDKLRGIWQDSEYRDSVLMWGAAEMDKIGWNTIWEAVKRETAAKYDLEGEALLEKAGERFTEVIELTQVYDSVFARSAYMRLNSDFMKASTSFMGEPTLTANMIMDAGVQLRRKNIGAGKFARIFGSVFAGVVLADLFKSMWTVNREDNEEEPYFEMLLETYQKNIMGDLNPANYLPIARDISSMFEGYSADRDDLSLISDLVDGVGGWFDEDKALQDKIHNTFAPLSALAGVPIKNIVRDFRTVMNGINRFMYTITKDNYSSGEGLWQAFVDGSTDHPWLEWLSDSYREDYSTKQIDNELKSLAKATDEADEVDKVKLDRDPPKTLTIKDAKYTLSRADQRQWYDVRGAAAAELYTEFIDSMLYDTLSDEDKVKALGEIYSYANYLAKKDYCKANGIEYEDKTNSKLSDKLNAGYSIAQLMWEKYTFDEPKMKKTDKLAEIANSNMSMTDKLRSVYSLYVTEKENGELNTTKYDNIKAACDAGAPLSLVTKFMTYYSTIESSLDRRGDRVFKGVDGETADSKHELMERWLETTGHEMGDHGLVRVTDKMRYYIYAIAYPKSDNPFE